MKYYAIDIYDEECSGTTWVEVETQEEAEAIAKEEGEHYRVNEITKQEYDEIMLEFEISKRVREELEKEYDIGKMTVREYSKLCKEKRAEILNRK